MATKDSNRRDFTRLRTALKVRYKFLSSTVKDRRLDEICEGSTINVSIGGLLLVGPIPNMDWVKEMLVGRMTVGVNFQLPLSHQPLKALTRLAWVEAVDDEAITVRMGLRVVDIPAEHRSALSEFIIKEAAVP